ncbi:MAG: nicotinate phosphoribosyltransferase [Tetrasphaera jenkinsii]|jgi:nicotinate phosphoribosyltransferase|uniref:Nicotinate phosphoribosyltransferase n=1 Tax=Nostocoides jenkinsii Ben 74 TaxID=1193518 RepID=A0A077M3A6_9MICO|nr:nicotinate phosphoribosyltransferase [Tetrasphaera jenkinsii]MCI1262999.1 nicotinate phosphoribosyltransferase [Tetrasphaera jenkinsii]CCI51701.1 Nicotinate phosphoribosyltransferase pncB1 [Tetrasphaera jenkinsii Ben 74]
MRISAALLTDRYELSMYAALLADGRVGAPATFELFARRLPEGRRFGMVAGLGRFLDALTDFHFDDDTLAWLQDAKVIDAATATSLANWRFTGTIRAYREGETWFPNSPILSVQAPLGEGLILETLALSIFNHDSAIASAAARMVLAADGRTLIEMGSRRTHEEAAVATARAAYVAGFSTTSNLAAGAAYGVPTAGTVAHAFVLAHQSEAEAFAAQMAAQGTGTTILVDTYDTEQGIATAVRVAQDLGATGPGAIRIDSGDLPTAVAAARAQLDSLGATDTKIVVTSDLDEYLITELALSAVDAYGVGTRVATGSGHPTAGFVYKLVELDDRPVAKRASGKANVGGLKTPYRYPDGREAFRVDGVVPPGARPLQVDVVRAGEVLPIPTLLEAREYAAAALADLPPAARHITSGPPATTAVLEGDPA